MQGNDKIIKVLILGTSNSILKNGYVSGLVDSSTKIEVVNKSIGASPGIQFGCFLSMNFDEFDYVIFDSLPNDEQYSYETKGYSYNELQNQILFEILSSISSKVNLIIMGFVCKNYLVEKTDAYLKRKDIAIKLGVQFIDIPEILQSYSRIDKSTVLYEQHPAHPCQNLAYEIGAYLGHLLLTEKSSYVPSKNKDYSKNFKYIHSKELISADKLIIKTNSLMTEEFSVIESLDNKTFKLEQNGKLIGFNVNAAETNCNLFISQSSNRQTQVNLYYKKKPAGLLKLFVPMGDYFEASAIKIGESTASTSIVQPRMTVPNKDNTESSLHISSLLFWEGVPSDEYKELNQHLLSINNLTNNITHLIYKNKYKVDHINTFKNKLPILTSKAGHILVFDTIKNQCINIDKKTCLSEQFHPVVITSNESKKVKLFLLMDKFSLVPLYISKSGITKSYSEHSFKADSEMIESEGDFFYIKTEGYYLCAESSGKVIANRTVAKNWEMFTVSKD